jgi:hypothetical protein
MKRNLKSTLLIASITFGIGLGCTTFTGCERKPDTVGERVDDALDARPNEKLKDAGEDLKDGIEDAADEVKDAVKKD